MRVIRIWGLFVYSGMIPFRFPVFYVLCHSKSILHFVVVK